MPKNKSPSALGGIRVLDMTSVLMGPYATQLLGNFGAEIIKIESPEGDVMRHAGEMRNPSMGHVFMHANRNKRSIVLDLKRPSARPVIEKLLRKSDVLVYNLRPRAMANLGLSYKAVSAIKPDIIYAGGLGFSSRGRRAERPAYDDMIQSMSGVPWLMEKAGSNGPRFMPGAFADRFVGLHLALGIMAAITHKQRTGQGQRVDVPMYESMISLVLGEHLGGLTFIPPHSDAGYRRTLSKERRPYPTSDGYIAVLVYTDRQWKNFFDVIGQPSKFVSDTRFHSAASRSTHVDAVYGFLQSVMSERTTDAWLDLLEKADIPAARVNSIAQILEDQHLKDIGFFQYLQHPTEGSMVGVASPFELSASPALAEGFAPTLGQHSEEILSQIGYTQEEISELFLAGTVVKK